MVTCDNRSWTWMDVWRAILTGAFVPRVPCADPGAQIPERAFKLVIVEDSGEPYFCAGQRFEGWDMLAKELSGLYSEEFPEVALRVSFGMRGADTGLCQTPFRSATQTEMALSMIGKGTDGKPLVRMAFHLASDVASDSGSGSGA
jgi:hypothetical protein